MFNKPLEIEIDEMRLLGDQLVPYNYPLAPAHWEDDINILKTRELVIDGYSVSVHYNKALYEDHYLESLQILGKHSPFLPFVVVCKLAKMFLGAAELSLVEIFRENRKIYCWNLTADLNGHPIPSPYPAEVERCSYQGLDYCYMTPDQINFH